MHAAMSSVEPSGNDDVDFVNLMLPHHQGRSTDQSRTAVRQRSSHAPVDALAEKPREYLRPHSPQVGSKSA